ncbi:MAG: EVE domain-containing protein [Chloroflexi bacterium]|nr:EVE domain-containing protein [Chloroflexota bacterium]
MQYFLDLFSPETYEAFSNSSRDISGFRARQKNLASRVQIGDHLICYMTKLSRWVGILEVTSEWFEEDIPIFYTDNDPFTIRFQVKPLAWLDKEYAIPIRNDDIWNSLSFTKGHDKNSSYWTGKLRSSLNFLDTKDAKILEKAIFSQGDNGHPFPIDDYEKLVTHRVRRADKTVIVSIPQDTTDDNHYAAKEEIRESIKIQALLSQIGAKMGMKIWIPRNDKQAVLAEWRPDNHPIIDILPLNYDETTLKTIENIDVLWIRGRSIIRAFEVEHTTSIYSGILRMADLLALQPNMDIKLHIVAPLSRKEKVFREIKRPVFSLLERRALSDLCTYISYDNLSFG